MNKEREALKLALEALLAGDWYIGQLEMIVYSSDDTGTHENRAKVQAAITTLKAALAQPAQEPVGEVINHVGDVDYLSYVPLSGTMLYATPQQRPWVGLTTEDMATCINEPAWDLILRKAEQILKEKNT